MAVAIGRLLEGINVYEIIILIWCNKEINFLAISVGFVNK